MITEHKCPKCDKLISSGRELCHACQLEELNRDSVRCPNHWGGGATRCPRGGAALQIWQRKQWGD